jgi:ABC-2 type transport system ATP-binding protein
MQRVTDSIIYTRGIKKSFKHVKVLDGINLDVQKGTVFALLGPNGAGKTTLVRILSTLLKPDAGQATIAGYDVVREPDNVRSVMGLTGQYAAVDELLTGEENMLMMGRLFHLSQSDTRQRTAELLERFDLIGAAKRPVKTYSGGMRRRLDLAISLIAAPPIIFLDEPTTGLDPRSRLAMWGMIKQLVAAGATIFLTTQYLEEADQLADMIAVIDGGTIIAAGTADELKQRVGQERLELTLVSEADFERARTLMNKQVVYHDAQKLSLSVAIDGSARQIKHILDHLEQATIPIETIGLHTPTLDDVFLTLTGRHVTKETETGDANG